MALSEFSGAMDSVVADLERMAKGLREGRGGAREAGVRDLSKLVEVGVEGLVGLVVKLVQEGTRTVDVHDLLERGEFCTSSVSWGPCFPGQEGSESASTEKGIWQYGRPRSRIGPPLDDSTFIYHLVHQLM